MEAPEKIYLQYNTTNDFYGALWPEWFEERAVDDDIEYTRTDALIEKAIGCIDYNNRNGGCNFDGWEKDFKNYMKEQQ